jgi:predicted lysophospholipase L1 biosynthesis ABC-type transport system permease subunit
MKIPFIDGRDFRASDTYPTVAIVNQAFAKQYFRGENPVGRSFERGEATGARVRIEIVGFIRDARSRDDKRLPIRPTAYVPFQAIDAKGIPQPIGRGTLIVRTASANPLALASTLRREVARARAGFRVSNVRTQTEINQSHTVRERLLAMVATFFGVVAVLLAGVGLYGVLDYSVLQRRREIGIRLAIGAQPAGIARLVTVDVLSMVLAGALAGLGLGMASVRYVASLVYQVKATDIGVLALPSITIVAAAMVAALPAVIHAVRIDPVKMLRGE